MKFEPPHTPNQSEPSDGMGQFWAGFCPSCGCYDPVFGTYRISVAACCDSNHEPYQELYQNGEREQLGVVTSADENLRQLVRPSSSAGRA
jgi:hypothetical protein